MKGYTTVLPGVVIDLYLGNWVIIIKFKSYYHLKCT